MVARTFGKLTAIVVAKVTKPGLHSDGGGLYLQVTARDNAPPAKSWIFRFTLNGNARFMGLGSLHAMSLANARARATEYRRQVLDGIDPIEARKAQRSSTALDAAKAITFKAAAKSYMDSHQAGWRNAKHAAQWESTLANYAYPVIGSYSVQQVDVTLVMKVLEPIWAKKPETASRLRGRIESVLDWATARGYRTGENPARWRGHLENLLPRRSKVRQVKHHAALPYNETGAFVASLRDLDGTAARAFEFLILTVGRTGEVIGAKWPEIDLSAKVWTVPAERMKAGKEHRVPLSARAVEILRVLWDERDEEQDGGYVFPGGRLGKPLSNMALLALLKRMERTDITAHGFRSTFKDWAAERTNYPNELSEMALAHAIGDKVEAAYRRGDMFEKRQRLMADWAAYCETERPPTAEVVSLRAKAS